MPRGEDLLAEIDVERLPADRLDKAADPVDVMPYPLVAGVEDQRQRSDATLPVAVDGIPVALEHSAPYSVPDLVANPAVWVKQMA